MRWVWPGIIVLSVQIGWVGIAAVLARGDVIYREGHGHLVGKIVAEDEDAELREQAEAVRQREAALRAVFAEAKTYLVRDGEAALGAASGWRGWSEMLTPASRCAGSRSTTPRDFGTDTLR